MRDLVKMLALIAISDPFETLFVGGCLVIGSALIIRAAIVIVTGGA